MDAETGLTWSQAQERRGNFWKLLAAGRGAWNRSSLRASRMNDSVKPWSSDLRLPESQVDKFLTTGCGREPAGLLRTGPSTQEKSQQHSASPGLAFPKLCRLPQHRGQTQGTHGSKEPVSPGGGATVPAEQQRGDPRVCLRFPGDEPTSSVRKPCCSRPGGAPEPHGRGQTVQPPAAGGAIRGPPAPQGWAPSSSCRHSQNPGTGGSRPAPGHPPRRLQVPLSAKLRQETHTVIWQKRCSARRKRSWCSRLRPSPLWCLLPRHSALWSVLGQPGPRQQGPLLKQQTPTSHSSGGWGLRSGWRGARFWGGGRRCCRWDGCLRALCSLGGQPASSVSLLIRAPTPCVRALP